jgi:hypothetical protein
MWKTFTGTEGSPMSPINAPAGAAEPWHPTIIYMLVLIVAEIIIVGFLSRNLLK